MNGPPRLGIWRKVAYALGQGGNVLTYQLISTFVLTLYLPTAGKGAALTPEMLLPIPVVGAMWHPRETVWSTMMTRQLPTLALLAASASCVVKGNVPDLEQNALCVPGYQEHLPSFCDWAGSTDAIAYGKLTGMRWDFTSPLSLATGGDAPPGCEPVTPILVLDLEVGQVLRGPLVPGERITIVGQDTSTWTPHPVRDQLDRTAVAWAVPFADQPGLVLGQPLGVVLHHQPGGTLWGTSMEPFFLEEDGRVRFSTMRGMCSLAPPVATGDYRSVDELTRALGWCPTTTTRAEERRAAIDGSDAGWRPACHDRESVESDVDPED